MSVRSLYLAGFGETFRGKLNRAYAGRRIPLTENMLTRIYDNVVEGAQGLSRRDRGYLRTILYEQDRSVRAGLRLDTVGWVDGRSVPITGRQPGDFRGSRFRVVYKIDLVDMSAGTREAQFGIFRTDETVRIQEIIDALRQDEGPAVLTWTSHTIVRPGKEYDWTSLRILGVERFEP